MSEQSSSSPRPLSNQELSAIGLPGLASQEAEESIQDEQLEAEAEYEESEEDTDESEGHQDDDYAFEDHADDDSDDDESEEYEEGDEDEDMSPQEKKRLAAAEKQMREFQSRYDAEKARNDNLAQQFDTLVQQFNALRQQQPSDQEVDLSALEKALGDADDYVYVSEVLKQVKQHMKPSEDAQYKKHFESLQMQQSAWLERQPDIQEVRKIAVAPSPEQESYLKTIPTDQVGLFYAIKAQMLEKSLKELKNSHKKALKRSGVRKTPIPPTSGSGKQRSAKKPRSQMGVMEEMLYNYGKKLGRDLTAKAPR